MLKTWLQEREWKRVKMWLPKGYEWEVQIARRSSKKERATERIIMGFREGIKRIRDENVEKREEIMTEMFRLGRERWRLIGVYVNKNLDEKLEILREWMEEGEEGVKVLIGEDFNVRTDSEGGRMVEDGEEKMEVEGRRSKNRKVNGEKWKLCGVLEKLGWSILNRGAAGDEEGE